MNNHGGENIGDGTGIGLSPDTDLFAKGYGDLVKSGLNVKFANSAVQKNISVFCPGQLVILRIKSGFCIQLEIEVVINQTAVFKPGEKMMVNDLFRFISPVGKPIAHGNGAILQKIIPGTGPVFRRRHRGDNLDLFFFFKQGIIIIVKITLGQNLTTNGHKRHEQPEPEDKDASVLWLVF